MRQDKDFRNFLDKCARKDKDAWDTFVGKYCRLIYQYILRTLRTYLKSFEDDEVDEICNSIFLSLLDKECKRIRDFQGDNERSFMAYLRTICYHISIDYLRKRKNFVDLEKVQNQIPDKDNFFKLDHSKLKEIISALRADLPDRHNYLFRLIYEEELDSSEIAEILNIGLNAFHQLKFRMIKNIIRIAKKKKLYNDLQSFNQSPCFQS